MAEEKHAAKDAVVSKPELSALRVFSKIVGVVAILSPLPVLATLVFRGAIVIPLERTSPAMADAFIAAAGVLFYSWPFTALAALVLGEAVRRREPEYGGTGWRQILSLEGRLIRGVNVLTSILLVGAALYLMHEVRKKGGPNEGGAKGATRTIAKAQNSYREAGLAVVDGVGQYTTLATLANPGEGIKPFIDDVLGSGVKHGYSFVLTVTIGDPPSYTLTVTPDEDASVKSYFVDQTGVIRYTSDGSVPTAKSEPIQ